MNQNLRFGSEATSSARSSAISQRAPLKTVLGLLGASAVACAPETTTPPVVNNYYQGPDGMPVSFRQPVPSNCTMVASATINQGENLAAEVNGRSYRIQLDDLERARSRSGLPPTVLLPSAIYSITDNMGNVLARANIREGGVEATRVNGLTIQTVNVAPGYTFGAKWADTNVYRCQ